MLAERGWPGAVYGFGSVFGKGFRDSRRAIVGVAIGLSLLIVLTVLTVVLQFPTEADRQGLAASMALLPATVRGLLGEPINMDRVGGFVSWRLGNTLPIIIGLWSVIALSGTLAGEAARGSLDVLASAPISRVRLAVDKILVHVVGLTIALTVVALATWLSATASSHLPNDAISPLDALSHFAGIGLVSLTAGAVAFAVAPLLGRSAAAGVGGIALFAAFVINGYASVIPALGSLKGLSWLAWTAGHRPLAGVSDPGSVVAVAGLDLVLLAVGVAGFVRRDTGSTVALPTLRLPGADLGLSGPLARSFAGRLPASLGWGIAIGAYGLVIAASASGFVTAISSIPGIGAMIATIYPGVDWRTSAGILQLAFYATAVLGAGLAVAALVSGWSSDERERRLEVVLTGPITRAGWFLRSGVGLLGGVAIMAVMAATMVAFGAQIEGDDIVQPFLGALVVGLYAAALVGVGLAVGGLVGPGPAAAVTGGLALGFYLLDLLGTALRFPDPILQLSLVKHLGQPIVGRFDWLGIALCIGLAIGGLAIGAWGLTRRDLRV